MPVLDATALDTDPAGMAYLAAILRSGSGRKPCPRPARPIIAAAAEMERRPRGAGRRRTARSAILAEAG